MCILEGYFIPLGLYHETPLNFDQKVNWCKLKKLIQRERERERRYYYFISTYKQRNTSVEGTVYSR